jgi:hypothetical protein
MWSKRIKTNYYKIYNKQYYEENKIRLKLKKQARIKKADDDIEFLKFLDYYFLDESLSESSVFELSESESGI